MTDDELKALLKTFGWFGSESWWKMALPRFRLLMEIVRQEHLQTLRDTQEKVEEIQMLKGYEHIFQFKDIE